jgi:hypothetical protein
MLRRGAVTWYPVDVTVLASLHGLPEGPVRDAVLREVLDERQSHPARIPLVTPDSRMHPARHNADDV